MILHGLSCAVCIQDQIQAFCILCSCLSLALQWVSDSLVIPQVVMTLSGNLKMPQRPASSAPVKMVRSSDSRGRRA